MSLMQQALRGNISRFLVMEAFREAAEIEKNGTSIIHLSLGQPASPAPRRVLEAVADRVLHDQMGYTNTPGIPALRERIAQHYWDEYGVRVPAERIFTTVGSSAALFMSMIAAFDVGDTIALVTPSYPAYLNIIDALGLKGITMPTTRETNYQPTLEMLQALPEVPRGLIIASPSNPTGTVIDPHEFERIIRYCEEVGIRLISDEIYHRVTYGDVQVKSALNFSDRMITYNSFSKYYLLTGWRLGWVVMPEDLCHNFESLLQSFFISPPTISQYAALEAFDCAEELDKVVDDYAINRAIMLEELPKAGLNRLSEPQGGFYIYANVSALTNDSQAFCRDMLHEAHVCAVSGLDFDREQGSRYVRFSYAGSQDDIREACRRLQKWLTPTLSI